MVTTAKFFEKVKLNAIKVYMKSTMTTQFLMQIQVTDGPNLIFFKSYPLHVYTQLIEYVEGSYGETKYARALTIPRVDFEGTNLTVEITFTPMVQNKTQPFNLNVAMEFFGSVDENLIDQATTKY